MSRESFVQSTRFLLLQRLDLLEKSDKCLRVVSCLVDVLQAKIIGFCLKATLEADEGQWQTDAGSRSHSISNAAAYEDQGNGSDIRPVSPGHLTHRVAGAHVGDLMGHHAGEFSLF